MVRRWAFSKGDKTMSTIAFVNYYTTTGQITSIGHGSPTIPDVPEGMSRYLGTITGNSDGRYFLNDTPTDRPTMSLVVSGLIVSGVPISTSLTVRDAQDNVNTYQVDDGVVDLTGSSPGAYTLLFENFPYQAIQEIITV